MLVYIVTDTYTNEVKQVYTTQVKAQEWIDRIEKEYGNGERYEIRKYWAI